jgi:hypothetical protein
MSTQGVGVTVILGNTGGNLPINAPSSITTSGLGMIDVLTTSAGAPMIPPIVLISADPLAVADTFLMSFMRGVLTLARIEVGTSGVVKDTTVATYAKKRFRSKSIDI